MQGLAAKQRADEQPVRAKRAAALHQLPDRIVCPMQAQRVDNQIVAGRGQVQHVSLGDNRCGKSRPNLCKGRDHGNINKFARNFGQAIFDVRAQGMVQEQARVRRPAAPVAKAAIDVVEEDDEFEEFENENWGAEEEDTSDAKQWMDNWEDDDSGDVAFIQKLRDQLRSK